MSWTDYEFDEAFLGLERGAVVHRFEVTRDLWHVCYVDSHDDYHHGYYRFQGGKFEPIELFDTRITDFIGFAKAMLNRVALVMELPVTIVTGGYPHHIPAYSAEPMLVQGDF